MFLQPADSFHSSNTAIGRLQNALFKLCFVFSLLMRLGFIASLFFFRVLNSVYNPKEFNRSPLLCHTYDNLLVKEVEFN